MTCRYALLDGAYVLGALAPAERREYERHLPGCAECSRAVGELAGLPGLLAHAGPADLVLDDDPPVPQTLLPALLREARGSQRRRTVLVAAVAAAVTALGLGGLAAGGAFDGAGRSLGAAPAATSPAPSPESSPMHPVGASPVAGEVSLASVAWGTRLDLTCSYESDREQYEAAPDAAYALVVRTRDGRVEQVATWHGLPGRTMHLTAATATRRDDIAAVEMRTADGIVVLRLRA